MDLFVEFASGPIVVDTECPRFSWTVPFTGQNKTQSAYQVQVASSAELLKKNKPDLWDSGIIKSQESVHIRYGGRKLASNQDVFWRVQVWDEKEKASRFSQIERFGTPLFHESDWHATWIGLCDPREPFVDPACFMNAASEPRLKTIEPDPRAPMLRKVFKLTKEVQRARAYVAGVGLYEFSINGQKAGDDVLATSRTEFRKRILYSCYDITSLLQKNDNAIGVLLGNGWYSGQKKYWGWQMQWYGSPRALVQLEIEYADGTTDRIVSDHSWQGTWSPITFNCLHDGENYDARLEQKGWNTATFDAKSWPRVNEVPSPGGKLAAINHEPERIVETLPAVSMTEPKPGVFVYNFGRNIAGWARISIKNGLRGQTVKLRFAERIEKDGTLNCTSHEPARHADEYIMKGAELETYEPRFTYHGFQYVEVSGYPGIPDIHAIEARFVYMSVAKSGHFECSSPLINNIHQCTLQSQICNLQMGVPTDDTQRPERMGWGADAWASAHEAMYNLWMPRVYTKWIRDYQDQQDDSGLVGMITPRAGIEEDLIWSCAFFLIPFWQYIRYGDRQILEENYSAFKRYMDYLAASACKEIPESWLTTAHDRLLCPATPLESRLNPKEKGYLQLSQWGDHLATTEGYKMRTDYPLSIATAFYFLDAVTMADIAETLGHKSDVKYYRQLAEKIKDAFNQNFFDAPCNFYDGGTQSAQVWPLAFGLVPAEQYRPVADYLYDQIAKKQRRLTTGYIATQFAIDLLSRMGQSDLVWRLANATDYPSWGYMLRHGQTTTTETWDGENGSMNHVALGAALDQWLYSTLAGIRADPQQPGFEHVIIAPYFPSDLQWARASIHTMRGTLVSSWRQNNEDIDLTIAIPANCSAEIHLPAKSTRVLESGKPVAKAKGIKLRQATEQSSIVETGSGVYRFRFSREKQK